MSMIFSGRLFNLEDDGKRFVVTRKDDGANIRLPHKAIRSVLVFEDDGKLKMDDLMFPTEWIDWVLGEFNDWLEVA